MTDDDWAILAKRIANGKCTPFLGAGVHGGRLPTGARLSEQLADAYRFPVRSERHDLARVAQYIAVKTNDPMRPKSLVLESIHKADASNPVDFTAPFQPHRLLAELSLPVYMTTNYDDVLTRALSRVDTTNEKGEPAKKRPREELCPWNRQIRKTPFATGDFAPTVAEPVVYHLHGHKRLEQSLVLTEDDYLDFLVNIWQGETVIPDRIRESLTSTSLLFLGYRMSDWNFRVIFRGLVKAMEDGLRVQSIAVQLRPEPDKDDPQPELAEATLEWLSMYFDSEKVKVFWGTVDEFMRRLKQECGRV